MMSNQKQLGLPDHQHHKQLSDQRSKVRGHSKQTTDGEISPATDRNSQSSLYSVDNLYMTTRSVLPARCLHAECHAMFPAIIWLPRGSAPRGDPANKPNAPFIQLEQSPTADAAHTVDAEGAKHIQQTLWVYSHFLFYYLKSHLQLFSDEILQQTKIQSWRCAQGSNLCRCSGEFHTDSPPHPPDHMTAFLWGQRTSNNNIAMAAMLED